MATTENMSLIKPVVSSTAGPTWATYLNALIDLIDTHDHATGKGVPVTPAGMDINDDLDFDNNKIENAKSVGLYSKDAADTAHVGSVQRIGSNLWWINGSGTAVQLTSGSSVISSGSGALVASSPASFPYTILTSDAQKVLIVDSGTAARTLTLPAATNAMAVWIKDGDGNAKTNVVTVTPDGTDTIDGTNGNYLIDWNFGGACFISDGVSKWFVI